MLIIDKFFIVINQIHYKISRVMKMVWLMLKRFTVKSDYQKQISERDIKLSHELLNVLHPDDREVANCMLRGI